MISKRECKLIFVRDVQSGCFVGTIDVRPQTPKQIRKKVPRIDPERLCMAYGWIANKLVYQYAKTTPIEERRGIADEAWAQAMCDYREGFGPLKEFLTDRVKMALLTENKRYVKSVQHETRSLDKPLVNQKSGDPFTLHDMLPSAEPFSVDDMEDRVARGAVCQILLGRVGKAHL